MVVMSSDLYSQKASKERVKALKVAFITERLDLSSSEAQKFWPIYNDHEDALHKIKKLERESMKTIKEANGPDGLQESEAKKLVRNYISWEEQKVQARKRLFLNLEKVMSDKKILQLIKAEMDFKRRLLKQLRERKK